MGKAAMLTNEQTGTAKPVAKEAIEGPVDKEAVRKKINEMNENIAQLYAMSDKLDKSIAESARLLKNLQKKRKKHQLSTQQNATGPLGVNHHGQHAVHPQLPQILSQNQNANTMIPLWTPPLLDYMGNIGGSGLFGFS
ncbi:hypothetical protein KAF25_006197 [Fusarium avenaceum]|uniref:Uncharacterized protein n=1 Tax=Fusarium avenaceum TaxID=40199 RepID=A0A9P7HF23_9HYPO|nr:hypothetical protein KAF25_006197 [Fusarium avenaceum]